MSPLGDAGRRVLRAVLVGLTASLAILLLPAGPAAAHPLDVYLQATYLELAPSTVTIEMDLSVGVLIAPRVLPLIDTDGNHHISDAEAKAYLQRVLRAAVLRVDDRPVPLALTQVNTPPYPTIKAGYGVLRLFATAKPGPRSAAAGEHHVFFRNGFSDAKAAYQVNAFVTKGAPVVLGAQQRDPTQRQTTVSYRVAAPGGSTASGASGQPAARQAQPSAPGASLAGYLQDPSLSVWVVLGALAAAALLGALHALTPGHAKTLIAAYLVGSNGTARNAVKLGAIVTFTHTASVILIGLVALLASQFLVPDVLVPVLEGLSGLLVLALGLRLLRQRWPRRRVDAGATSYEHVLSGVSNASQHHQHHPHEHHDHGRQHEGGAHSHALPAEGVTPRGLIAMGVSGGLVPCPEALSVMVLAVGVNRTVFGLGLILAFSIGLAAVLIGLGLLLVRSRSLLMRFDRLPAGWAQLLPLVSAIVVTVLGAGLVLRAVDAHLFSLL